jgi:ParB/RepB/Spo0J family partition protein
MNYDDLENVPLMKIINDNNRKYTEEDGFDQLVNSVKVCGIIEPPVLRRQKDGLQYKVIAGRRRIAAARAAEKKAILCAVIEYDDPASDEEIALAENVNRLAMHPLDEAAAFSRMEKRGASVAEIAKYYARSPQAIYQRLRLASLTEELKGMFRDGRMGISEAAVLAELPEEDQKDFFAQNGQSEKKIDRYAVIAFVRKKQRFTVTEEMAGFCEGCKTRTHNNGNDLFEEYRGVDDVCLDGDCYRRKWKALIEDALAEEYAAIKGIPTDNKIFFTSGIPELLYNRATHVEFFFADADVRFEVLREKDYEPSGPTNRKKDACWRIFTDYANSTIHVQRIGYKQKPPKEKKAAAVKGLDTNRSGSGDRMVDAFEREYGRETLDSMKTESGVPVAELLQKLDGKQSRYEFENDVKETVFERVIDRRIELDKAGGQCKDYFSLFMRLAEDSFIGSGCGFLDKSMDDQQKKWLKALTGKESLAKAALSLPDEAQKIFHYLLLVIDEMQREIPDLDDLPEEDIGENIFLAYAGMSVDEYRELYLKTAAELAESALKPKAKAKKGGKKKEADDDPAGEV